MIDAHCPWDAENKRVCRGSCYGGRGRRRNGVVWLFMAVDQRRRPSASMAKAAGALSPRPPCCSGAARVVGSGGSTTSALISNVATSLKMRTSSSPSFIACLGTSR